MTNHKTAEEARQDYISRMGGPLGKVYHALWQEVAWLYTKWDEFVQLYGTKPSRIDLLNTAAPRFFRIVQDSLWEEVILHIARLTDPPSSVGKANLTIKRLPDLVSDPETKQTLTQLIAVTDQLSDFCRDWRNRRIAHSDLRLAIEEGIVPLMPASRKKVRDALDSIAEVLNVVSQYYTNSTTKFDLGGGHGGAVTLLYIMDDGLKAAAERKDRIRQGEYRKEDHNHRDL